MTVSGRIGMCSGFNGPPIITGGDSNSVDPVHNAFVVGCRSIWVGRGKGPGFKNRLGNLLTLHFASSQLLDRDQALGAGHAPVGKIG